MIPRIAQRGSSFKGAGQYYLHDKGKDTKERVAWTLTHNIPTDNPELAMKWMSYTAMNKDQLKQQAGVAMSGRKGIDKPVYAFSLAWQPEQNPDENHMKDLAFDALGLLGLSEHEAVLVAHQDTAHPHVHVITNLVHPQTGKTLRPQNDKLIFSSWAEEYEKKHGKIYCEERVVNNERRRQGQKTKHRETKIDQALIIQNLYNQAESAQDFQQSLEEKGWTLSTGDRRGFLLVGEDGKILSLSRQLKGQRAADIKDRLESLENLPNGQTLSEDRKHFFRDQYEAEHQKRIVDAAIKADEERQVQRDEEQGKEEQTSEGSYQSFADSLDAKRLKEQNEARGELRKEKAIRAFYNREDLQKKIEAINKSLLEEKSQNKKDKLRQELEALDKTLANIDQRMQEKGVNPDYIPIVKDTNTTPEKASEPEQTPVEKPTKEQLREAFRKEQMKKLNKDRDKGRDQGFDLDMS